MSCWRIISNFVTIIHKPIKPTQNKILIWEVQKVILAEKETWLRIKMSWLGVGC